MDELPREAGSPGAGDVDLGVLVLVRCLQTLGTAVLALADCLETGEVGGLLAPPGVCAGCECKPERTSTIVSGFVFCTVRCFRRSTQTVCAQCGGRLFLIYDAPRDYFYNQCSCGHPADFRPRPDSRVTKTKDQIR